MGKSKGGSKPKAQDQDSDAGGRSKLKPATSINVRHILCEKFSKKEEALEKLRNSGKFDLVVDFDPVLRNESVPWQLKEELQSGDYLHPNVKGYELLADSFPVDELEIWGKDRKVVNGFE